MKIKNSTLIMLFVITGGLYGQTVTTFTGGTPDDGIAVDSNGNIYCSQYTGDTIFKFTPTGEVSSFATGLNTPNGLAFNSNDELYACDGQGNTVYIYDLDGNVLQTFPITGHPSGMIKTVDGDDMVATTYVGDTVFSISTDGTIDEISSDVGLNGPVGLAYDDAGTLYVGNFNDRDIYRVSETGELDFVATVGNTSNLGFITYGQGMLWGTVLGEHKIYKINPEGINDVTVFAGSTAGGNDGDISEATFSQPNGILFNQAQDTMYVTDFGTKNLRIITDFTLGTGDSGLDENTLQLSPNPAQNHLFLEGKLPYGKYEVGLYSVSGKLLSEMSISSIGNRIAEPLNVSHLHAGVYFVKISDGKNIITKRLIKM
ncbi:MAG: T9SS type A sorting domain-containing protein [Flavobacteriaceae bacterium]|nr:T9SS type A sorting domain-containing protein [Flavobacteriaceae bacterium]